MTSRTRTLLAALMGTLALGATTTVLAGNGHGHYPGHGWGARPYPYYPAPYGYFSIQTAPPVVYAPPAYYGPRYGYPVPPVRYGYPVLPTPYGYPLQPSFSFGMTVPLD